MSREEIQEQAKKESHNLIDSLGKIINDYYNSSNLPIPLKNVIIRRATVFITGSINFSGASVSITYMDNIGIEHLSIDKQPVKKSNEQELNDIFEENIHKPKKETVTL